jgi:DegV family protein with EDD domain
VAVSSDERREELSQALASTGFEVTTVTSDAKTREHSATKKPDLIVVDQDLTDPESLYADLGEALLRVPPILVSGQAPAEAGEEQSTRFICYSGADFDSSLIAGQARLLLLAWDLGAEPSDALDRLYGDLTRISVGDLLRVLLRYQHSCHVALAIGAGADIWVDSGAVVNAQWGRVSGLKAFFRLMAVRSGSFSLSLEPPQVAHLITDDLATLATEAGEEKLRVEELYRRLPVLSSQVGIGDSEAGELTETERELMSRLAEADSLGDLVDLVDKRDSDVVAAIVELQSRGLITIQEPQHHIHVVTDSTCDLLPSVVRRNGITVVPLSVIFGERSYKTGVDLQTDEFYRLLTTSDLFPSTNPPGQDDFLEAYKKLIATGDILSIHISKKQSLTARHAEAAVKSGADQLQQLRDGSPLETAPVVRVVDSLSNSVGLGLLVLFACRMARKGVKLDEIAIRLEDMRLRMEFLFIVDTLKYLQKGGRIGKAQALIGGLLGIKPILGMQNGEVVPVDKVRGGRKVQPRLLEIFRERLDSSRPVFCALAHAAAPKWAGRLQELLEKEYSLVELLAGEIGPIVGAHTGPGTVGCILFQPNEDELELLKG